MIDTVEDRRKFVILYEKYRYLMMKVAYDVLGDFFLAEDAVHEAFIKVEKNIKKIEDVDSQETKRYLLIITKNLAIDIYRKRCIQMKKELFVDGLGEKDMPLIYLETNVDNCILDILKKLPIKYRDVFGLKYLNKMENREIADALGISEGNVRQRIARGKAMIQEAINGQESHIER